MINSSKLKILTFGTAVIMLAVFLPIFANAENLSVSAIEVVNIADNSATIKWRTPEAKTSGIVYVGESENKFERSFRCDSYLYDHEVTVGNLQKNKTYFYKIVKYCMNVSAGMLYNEKPFFFCFAIHSF